MPRTEALKHGVVTILIRCNTTLQQQTLPLRARHMERRHAITTGALHARTLARAVAILAMKFPALTRDQMDIRDAPLHVCLALIALGHDCDNVDFRHELSA